MSMDMGIPKDTLKDTITTTSLEKMRQIQIKVNVAVFIETH